MKVIEIKEVTAHRVTTDEEGWRHYTRYGPNSWTQTMGESEEQLYEPECQEVEAAFQRFLQETNSSHRPA